MQDECWLKSCCLRGLTRLCLGPKWSQLLSSSQVWCPSEGTTLLTIPAPNRIKHCPYHSRDAHPLPLAPSSLSSRAGAAYWLPDIHGYIIAALNPFFNLLFSFPSILAPHPPWFKVFKWKYASCDSQVVSPGLARKGGGRREEKSDRFRVPAIVFILSRWRKKIMLFVQHKVPDFQEWNLRATCQRSVLRAGVDGSLCAPKHQQGQYTQLREKKAPFSHSEAVALDISKIMGPRPNPISYPNPTAPGCWLWCAHLFAFSSHGWYF